MNNNLQNSKQQATVIKPRTGILLINLGTPDAPRTREVRAYLRSLLSCDRVMDINPVGRWLLLNLIVLPFRLKMFAKPYQEIWLVNFPLARLLGRLLLPSLVVNEVQSYTAIFNFKMG